MSMGDFQGAIALFGRAVAQDESDFRVFGLRAMCYEYLEKIDSAISGWSTVMKLCPQDADPIMEEGPQ